MTDLTNFVDWKELKGKEARGVSNDVDLGEVQELGQHYIMTQKGRVSKDNSLFQNTWQKSMMDIYCISM